MDCLITKTHDHPWLKGHLPESLRKQRKLTKIESGLYHVGDIASHSLELLEISLLKEDDYLYNVASFPHIFLGGSKSDIDNLAQRIYYLSKSVLGLEFLNKLEKTKIDTLCVLEKFRDISQVILSYPKDAEPNFQISENLLPLEWVTEKNHEECARILEEIENGTGAVFIQKDHPQKEKILSVLRQLSMRPIGRLLLTRIDAFNKKNIIEIRYAKGLNIFQQGDINFVSLDLEHNHQSYSSLEKATERFVFIPNWCQSLVAHELIHALHCFLVKFEGELDLSLEKMINYLFIFFTKKCNIVIGNFFL